jgi:membrane-associated phospholipid phosphatase
VKGSWWAQVLKEPGEFRLACAVAALLALLHVLDWRRSAFIPVAGVMGLVNAAMKWVVGRHRPFRSGLDEIPELLPWNIAPFRTGFGLSKLTSNLSFGSGHAAAAFATATALAILFPRWRWLFYAVATITAIERVAENAHWASDSVAGAALSYFGVNLLWRLGARSIDRAPAAQTAPADRPTASESR